jgi:hypothetical protein
MQPEIFYHKYGNDACFSSFIRRNFTPYPAGFVAVTGAAKPGEDRVGGGG